MKKDKNNLKKLDTQFYLKKSIKLGLISVFGLSVSVFLVYIIYRFNMAYLVNSNTETAIRFRNGFLTHLDKHLFNYSFFAFSFCLSSFFVGYFLAYFSIRPFRVIEKFLNKKNIPDLKKFPKDTYKQNAVLFQTIKMSIKYFNQKDFDYKNNLESFPMPKHLDDIHGPNFPKANYIHLIFTVFTLYAVSHWGIYKITFYLYENMIQTIHDSDPYSKISMRKYFEYQLDILGIFNGVLGVSLFIPYLIYARELYKTINEISYCFLRDIRKVLKGKIYHRIYLRTNDPGKFLAYLINKFLDKQLNIKPVDANMENITNIQIDKSKVSNS